MLLVINEDQFDSLVLNVSGNVLVEFYAPWCNNCGTMESILEMIEEENFDKLKIYKIDIEENERLADRFFVMNLPTMILFKDGKPTASKAGLTSYNDMMEWLKL